MTIFRVQHNRNYTTINNFIATDKRLSMKAKGIWMYAFSRPDDWEFHLNDIINQSTDGRDSIRAGLRELEECGYLQRNKLKDEKGQYSKAEWFFYETPVEFKKIIPRTDFPLTENQEMENHPLLNTKRLSTEKKQQQAKPKVHEFPPKKTPPSEAVVVSLDKLGLTSKEKLEITKKYSSKEIDIAVERVLAWTTRTDNLKALYHVLKNSATWKDEAKQEEVEQQNYLLLKKVYHLDGKTIKNTGIVVSEKYIEFRRGEWEKRIYINSRNFKNEVNEQFQLLRT